MGPWLSLFLLVYTLITLVVLYTDPATSLTLGDAKTWIFLVLYLWFFSMAVWALVKLMRTEPGYIPLKYNYKWQNFSHLTREIYRHIAEY